MRLLEEDEQRVRWEFEEFKRVRFPGMSSSYFSAIEAEKEAAHLHLDLVEYDAFIAGFVTRLSNGKDVDEEKLYINGGLKHRLEDFGKRYPDSARFVEEHLRYLGTIHQLVNRAKERAGGG